MKMSGFEYVKTVHNYRNVRKNISNTQIYYRTSKLLPELNINLCIVVIDFFIKLVLEN